MGSPGALNTVLALFGVPATGSTHLSGVVGAETDSTADAITFLITSTIGLFDTPPGGGAGAGSLPTPPPTLTLFPGSSLLGGEYAPLTVPPTASEERYG